MELGEEVPGENQIKIATWRSSVVSFVDW
jgi:hypothetical protein